MNRYHVLITCRNPKSGYQSIWETDCVDLIDATRVLLTFRPRRMMEVVEYCIEVVEVMV